VGIIIPCMPLLVSQLSIPASEFGLVISAFGLSKLIGNIPSGYFVEKYGRKPSMVVGLGMCGVGLGALGEWFLWDCSCSRVCTLFSAGLQW
jgi:MFS family permease